MTEEELKDRIIELMEIKSFADLSPAEKEMVLVHFSAQEYDAQHTVLKESQTLFAKDSDLITPDLETLGSLKKSISKTKMPAGLLLRIQSGLEYKLPLYQSVAASAGFILFLWFYSTNEPRIQYVDREVTVYKTKLDTLVIDKIVEVPVIHNVEVVKWKEREVEKSKNVVLNSSEKDDMAVGNTYLEEFPEIENLSSSFGNSKIDNEDLAQFRVKM